MFGRRYNELPEGLTWYEDGQNDMEFVDDQEIVASVGTHACQGCGVSVVAIHTYCYGCLKQKEDQAKAHQVVCRGQRMQKWLYDQFNNNTR